MGLTELGKSINAAMARMLGREASVDEKMLDEILKEICKALLEADVNVKLVASLRASIKAAVAIDKQPAGVNKRRLVHKAVFEELCRLLDPGVPPYRPTKGATNVVMFVGLQGAGKTTSCCKMAAWYARKGWRVALICADTFRAGAFDQLQQNAGKARIPFYGSHEEKDAVEIVREGLLRFREEGFELIIIDTSGRHRQEIELFDEMRQIAAVAQPDNVVFVMDAAIGQAADAQARAFKAAVDVGSIIISKTDGHAKGGGAISGVAATGSPIIFIGTGEHMHDIEPFNARSFVGKMLGMGDMQGLVETVQDMQIDPNTSVDMLRKMEQGQYSLRDMGEHLRMVLSMGPLSRVMGMLPGNMGDLFSGDADGPLKMRRCLTVFDSMARGELDSDGKCFTQRSEGPSRIRRIARGSGVSVEQVEEVLAMYRRFAAIIKRMGPAFKQQMGGAGMGGMMQRMQSMMASGSGNMQEMMRQMQSMAGGMAPSEFGAMAGRRGHRQPRRK